MILRLRHGDKVLIQNQNGNHPTKWDRTGEIKECRPHNQYAVKIDASGRVTLRNRQYLRKYTPSHSDVLRGVTPTVVESRHGGAADQIAPEPESQSQGNMDNSIELHGAPHTTSDPEPAVGPNVDSTPTELRPTPTSVPPQLATPIVPPLRRSQRVREPTRVYDPSTGKYIQRNT